MVAAKAEIKKGIKLIDKQMNHLSQLRNHLYNALEHLGGEGGGDSGREDGEDDDLTARLKNVTDLFSAL